MDEEPGQLQDYMLQSQVQSDLSRIPQDIYNQNTDAFNMGAYLLTDKAVPLSMRNRFFQFWSNVIFGNYTEMDIKYLMYKFKEWRTQVMMYIPDDEWGVIQRFNADNTAEGQTDDIDMDLNTLFSMLQQIYFINLTRGRGGFTVKELNPARKIFSDGKSTDSEKKKYSLF